MLTALPPLFLPPPLSVCLCVCVCVVVVARCRLEKVVVSPRVETTPCILVTSQYGNSANMERIMRSQAFSDPSR